MEMEWIVYGWIWRRDDVMGWRRPPQRRSYRSAKYAVRTGWVERRIVTSSLAARRSSGDVVCPFVYECSHIVHASFWVRLC